MSKKYYQTAISAVVVGLLSSPVYAGDPLKIVISPSRVAQDVVEVGSSVVLLQGDELRERGVEYVEDALQQIPSLIVSSQGSRGSQVQIRARGNEANHILVLIDGMRVSNASTGEYDFANLSMASVESIEVLFGPQSTLYGSDAMAGVINITTKKGREGFGGNVAVKLGELGTQSVSARVSGANQGFHYALTAEDFSTDGISSGAEKNGNSEKDPFEKQSVNLKAGFDSKRFSTSLILSQNDSEFAFDGSDAVTAVAVDETVNKQLVESTHMAWLLEWPLMDGRFNNQIQVSNISNDYDIRSFFFGANSDFNTQTERDTLEYRGNFQINSDNSLQFGFESIEESLGTQSISAFGTSNFAGNVDQSGLYLNWLHKYQALDIALGARAGDHEEFGSNSTYRLTASYRLSDQIRLKAAHGTAYKAPSLQELFDTSFGGNPNLQPEESESSEIGVEYDSGDYFLGLTFFEQDTDELIRFSGVFPTGSNANVGEARSQGLELTANKVWGDFELNTSLSKTRATETVNGVRSQRIRVPEWSANILANYHYDHGRIWLQALFRDERRDIQFTFPSQDVTLDSYTLWNLGASYRMKNQLTVSARVENLTDEDYEEVFSFGTRGRTAIVSADWAF